MAMIRTRIAEVSLIEQGIVRVKFDEDAEIGIDDIQRSIEASLKLTGGKKHAALLDARTNVSITQGAMKYGASAKVLQHRTATAMLTERLSVRIFGNFFNGFFRPKIRNRIFSNEAEAIEWLRSFSG